MQAMPASPFDQPMPAQEVLHKYWGDTLPVDPVAIALDMGVAVYYSQSLEVEGKFFYSEGTPTIEIKSSGFKPRIRFTAAHELGHYCLQHGESFRDPRQNFSIHNFDPHEIAANYFASELLMPENAVNYAVRIPSINTVQKIADFFGVSGPAMQIRLCQMGIL